MDEYQKYASQPDISSGGSSRSRGYSSKLDKSVSSLIGRFKGATNDLSSNLSQWNPSNHLKKMYATKTNLNENSHKYDNF